MEKDILATQRQEREAAQEADKKAYAKYAPLFSVRGEDKNGNPVFTEDKAALADAQRAIEYTLAQRGLINPTTGQTKNFGGLSDAERDTLMTRMRAVQRLRQTQGNWFWNADKGDSLNLDDFDAVEKGDELHFPKLSKRLNKEIRARKKDFIYGDGPSSVWKYNQTPDTTLLQNLTNPSRSR